MAVASMCRDSRRTSGRLAVLSFCEGYVEAYIMPTAAVPSIQPMRPRRLSERNFV